MILDENDANSSLFELYILTSVCSSFFKLNLGSLSLFLLSLIFFLKMILLFSIANESFKTLNDYSGYFVKTNTFAKCDSLLLNTNNSYATSNNQLLISYDIPTLFPI